VQQVKLGGLTISALTRLEWAELLIRDFQRSRVKPERPRILSSANGNVISLYGRDAAFRGLMMEMDAVDADGMPLVYFSRLKCGSSLPERVATTDFFHDAARVAEIHGMSFYLLGGEEAENARAVRTVRSRYPRLRIAGARHGFFDPAEEGDVVAEIRNSGADVLWVGLGVPREQAFMVRNRSRLEGLTWIKSCGGLFNFLSGTRRRAPVWVQRAGLEWSFRLVQEPRRLAGRYALTNVHALYRMLVIS
jgi:exopolysaccharide biosynthesis WecB/TagA/CpsF family protein